MIRANTKDYVAPKKILFLRPRTAALVGGLAAASFAIVLSTMLALRNSGPNAIAFQATVISASDAQDASSAAVLTRGIKVTQGAKFRTGSGEHLPFSRKGTRVLLAPDSVLSISRLDASGSILNSCFRGSVSAQVRKLSGLVIPSS